MSAAGEAPAAFVADPQRSGCRVILSWPAANFEPVERPATYFIAPRDGQGFGDGYAEVMQRWTDAMDACPDHVERTVAHLVGANRWEA